MRALLYWGACFLLSFLLTDCGTTPPPAPPIVTTQEVKIAIPVKCQISNLGDDPDYADDSAKIQKLVETIADIPTRLYAENQALLAARLQRIQRDKEKTAAINICAELLNKPLPVSVSHDK